MEQVGVTAMTDQQMTMLALGAGSDLDNDAWNKSSRIARVVRFKHASPSGMRLGKRITGIAVDSFALACKARWFLKRNDQILCANPWIAVAARLLGFNNLAVTGLYAEPGSRSWRLLRVAIRDAPVVTTAEVEAASWVREGGNAQSVLYGNTFGYPLAKHISSVPTIFVGGTSDRDLKLLSDLVDEVKMDRVSVRLLIADGSGPSRWRGENAEIVSFGRVSSDQFGTIMSSADIVFLPILDKERASGHMVCVGALECGLPVVSTRCQGMAGYVDGTFVSHLNDDGKQTLLHKLTGRGINSPDSRLINDFWRRNFSLEAYVNRVVETVTELLDATR